MPQNANPAVFLILFKKPLPPPPLNNVKKMQDWYFGASLTQNAKTGYTDTF